MSKSDKELFEEYLKHSCFSDDETENENIFYEYIEKENRKENKKENKETKNKEVIYSTDKKEKKQIDENAYKAFKEYLEASSIYIKEEPKTDSRNKRKKQNKNGIINIKATLDLHGYTQDESLVKIRKFITECIDNKESPVLVIHGKGYHSENGKSVLKDIVEYYAKVEGRDSVISMENAPANMGGSGAKILHLRLRK